MNVGKCFCTEDGFEGSFAWEFAAASTLIGDESLTAGAAIANRF